MGRPSFSTNSCVEMYQTQKCCVVPLLPPQPWRPLPPARMSAIVRLGPKRAHPSHLHTNAPLRSNWLGLNPSDGSPVVDQSFDTQIENERRRQWAWIISLYHQFCHDLGQIKPTILNIILSPEQGAILRGRGGQDVEGIRKTLQDTTTNQRRAVESRNTLISTVINE